MIKEDILLKAVTSDGQVRISIAHTTGAVEEARIRHQSSATATAAMGRVLTAALIMASDLKGSEDKLSIRINGEGPAGSIIATANPQGEGRVMISNPRADLPSRYPGKLAVGELVGKEGYLEVIKDLGLKQPFIGRVPLVSGEIGEDLSSYFYQSEQIPALVGLGVLVERDLSVAAAGGLIIQALPGADDSTLQELEDNVLEMGQLSYLLRELGSLEEVLEQAMKGVSYQVIDRQELAFACNCSRERLGGVLSQLADQELEEIYQEQGRIEVRCNFCNEVYHFMPGEVEALRKEKARGS